MVTSTYFFLGWSHNIAYHDCLNGFWYLSLIKVNRQSPIEVKRGPKNDTNCSQTVFVILVNLPYLDIPKYWHSVVPLSTKLNGKLDQSVENWICQCFSSLVRQIVFSSAEQVFDNDDFIHIENGVKRVVGQIGTRPFGTGQFGKGQFGTGQFSTKIVKTDNLAPRRQTYNLAPT